MKTIIIKSGHLYNNLNAYKSVADRWCIPGLPDRGIKSDYKTLFNRLGIMGDSDILACSFVIGCIDNDISTIMNDNFQKEATDSLDRILINLGGQAIKGPIVSSNGKVIPIEKGIYPYFTLADSTYLIVNYSSKDCLSVDSEGSLIQVEVTKDKKIDGRKRESF